MKLSIITINLNNAKGLRKTIESVVSQTFTDYEYIVIDGASTDGSVDIIKEFADKITYWISESDNGIYNAMNKGILKANGEYCLFLNSGDWLVDQNVIFDFVNCEYNEDVISGNVLLFDNSNYILYQSPQKDALNFLYFYRGSIPHPASFIKRDLFTHFGFYNETNKIVSDMEFFVKVLVLNNCSYNHLDRNISCFNLDGISSQKGWNDLHEKEAEGVYQSAMSPLIYKAFKQLIAENLLFKTSEVEFREYMNLKKGKFAFLIKLTLWIKALLKKR